jgi:oligoendopeptidase F
MEKLTIKKTDWDLTPVLKSEDKEFILKKRKEWEKASYDFINKWKKQKDYLTNSKILKEALDEYEKWRKNFGTEASEAYYFYLKTFIDQNNPKLKAKYGNVEEFSKKIENDIQFFILNIGKISKKNQKTFLENPDLGEYKHFLERVFLKSKFWLTEKEEKIMNLKEKSSYSSWVDMVSGLLSKEEKEVIDEDGGKVKKTYTDMVNLMMSAKKEVRDKSAEAFNEIMKKYSEFAEIEINAILNDKKINDELRGFKRADSARHLSDDIDSKIVDSLIDAVRKRFDISKKFYEFKAKLLGLKRLEYHERNIPYGNINKNYNYGDSVNLVYSVFNNLDETNLNHTQISASKNWGKKLPKQRKKK